jgi:hypothetical protein
MFFRVSGLVKDRDRGAAARRAVLDEAGNPESRSTSGQWRSPIAI